MFNYIIFILNIFSMQYIIIFFSLLAFIIYYSYIRVEREDDQQLTYEGYYDKLPRKSKKSQKNNKKGIDNLLVNQDQKEKKKRVFSSEETRIVRNVKELILTSFKEGKDLINVHIQNEGKLILTSDVLSYSLFRIKE